MPRPPNPATRTPTERAAEARRRLLASGGRQLSIHLSPAATARLARLRAAYGTDTAVIEAALARLAR